MAETEHARTQEPINPDVQFEHTDVNARRVFWAGAGGLLAVWIFAGTLYFFFVHLVHYRAESGPPAPERATRQALQPPEPRIQSAPRADLQTLRAYEDSQLHKYRWIDRKKGIAGIPIEQAIQITARRGIPRQRAPAGLNLYPPQAGTRETGFEGKVQPEPR